MFVFTPQCVSTAEGEMLARKLDVSFYETSALTSDNVEEVRVALVGRCRAAVRAAERAPAHGVACTQAFTTLTTKCYHKFVATGSKPRASGVKVTADAAEEKKCC